MSRDCNNKINNKAIIISIVLLFVFIISIPVVNAQNRQINDNKTEYQKNLDETIFSNSNQKEIETNNFLKKIINKLYQASNAGVQIRIIVRGICCLMPGIEGMSENIEAISIIDRFLEHSRIYIFYNGGKRKYFVASADWMQRNLNRRIEVAFPIYNQQIKVILQNIINIQLNDTVKARIIDKAFKNCYRQAESADRTRSQMETYHYLQKLTKD